MAATVREAARELLEQAMAMMNALLAASDRELNSETAAGQWTYRAVAKHTLVVAQDSLNTMAADQAARGHSTRG